MLNELNALDKPLKSNFLQGDVNMTAPNKKNS